MTDGSFPKIERLIPHRGPMRLIDRIVAAEEDAVTAEARIDPSCAFATADRRIPSYVGLEMMAQTISAYDGLRRFKRDLPPSVGFLLGCRKYVARQPYLAAGTVLTITGRMVFNDGDMASFDCIIRDENPANFAEAALNVYNPADPEAFLRQDSR